MTWCAWRASSATSRYSVGDSRTSWPSSKTEWRLRSTDTHPDHERHLGRRLPSPKHGADSGEQFLGAEWLGQIVVRSHVERENIVGLVAPGADDDHRRDAAAFERGEDMPAVHEGQADVE